MQASVVGSPFLVSCVLGDVSVELEVCEVEGISKVSSLYMCVVCKCAVYYYYYYFLT